jgi:nucleotide-binding universal stress UspA family protein
MSAYGKILVAVDGSRASNKGLREAIRLAKAERARLFIVHVVDEYPAFAALDGMMAGPLGAVDQADLHSAWSLDEARRHELARMQEAFAREWLFYRDDPRAAAELQAYAEAELAVGELNVRFERLARFSTLQPNWTWYSARFERPVLRHLARRWPLEYRFDFEPAATLLNGFVSRS